MKTPVIGVTTSKTSAGDYTVHDVYAQSIFRSGGIPVLLPIGVPQDALAVLVDRLDGVLLTGGGDISLRYFEGKPHIRIAEDPPGRDELELALARLAVRKKSPLFGICRGLQVINVALGGTLYTDIEDQFSCEIRHDRYPGWPRDFLAHPVHIQPDSRLRAILGKDRLEVNSFHHQAINRIAPGLVPTAFSPDGLIEAVEISGHPFGIGVQWHPECMPDSAEMRALFAAFVESASRP